MTESDPTSFPLTQEPDQPDTAIGSPAPELILKETPEYQLLTPIRGAANARGSRTTAHKTGKGASSVAKLRALKVTDISAYNGGPADRMSYFSEL